MTKAHSQLMTNSLATVLVEGDVSLCNQPNQIVNNEAIQLEVTQVHHKYCYITSANLFDHDFGGDDDWHCQLNR